MHPATRTQSDGLGDVVSAETSLSFDPREDTTRQEFADEADVNVIIERMRRAGAGLPLTPPSYGEVDYDLDLLSSFALVAQARDRVAKLPPELLEQYGGIDALLRGWVSGTLEDPAQVPEQGAPGSIGAPGTGTPPAAGGSTQTQGGGQGGA